MRCIQPGSDLDANVANIDRVKDERIYGLFPEFVSYLRKKEVEGARARLLEVQAQEVGQILQTVPDKWAVPKAAFNPW